MNGFVNSELQYGVSGVWVF